MKTFSEICEEICNGLERPTRFIVAQMDEANLLVDKSTFPVMIWIPPVVSDIKSMGGTITPVIPFNAFLLDKDVKQTTRDYSYNETYKTIIEPMTNLARKFINGLEHYRHEDGTLLINEVAGGVENRQYRPAYDETDATLHGVVITCNINIIQNIETCK